MRINLKQAVFAVCAKIEADETHYLNKTLRAVLSGQYLASKDLGRSLQAELFTAYPRPSGEVLYNLIGQAVVNDGDTVRRYIHAWRKSKMTRNETLPVGNQQVGS